MSQHDVVDVRGGLWDRLQRSSIVFFGDSITADTRANYISLLFSALEEQRDTSSVEVVTSAIDSSTIFCVLDRLPDLLIEHEPSIVSLFVGINDSKRFRYIDRPLVPVDAFEYGLSAFFDRAKVNWGTTKFLVMGLPPLCFDKIRQGEFLSEYWYWDEDEYAEYNRRIQKVAKYAKARFVDLDAVYGKAGGRRESLFISDGVHPNIKGHRLIAQAWLEAAAQ